MSVLYLLLITTGCANKEASTQSDASGGLDLTITKVSSGKNGTNKGKVDTGVARQEDTKTQKTNPKDGDTKTNPVVVTGDMDDLTARSLAFVESKLQKDSLEDSRSRDVAERIIRDSKYFTPIIRDIYMERNFRPVFVEYGGGQPRFTDQGKRVRTLLEAMPDHGLSAKDYQLDRLTAAVTDFQTAGKDYEESMKVLSGKRAKALWEFLDSFTKVPSEAVMKEKLQEKGFDARDVAVIAELEQYYPSSRQSRKKMSESVYQIDIIMLHGFFQFMLDFKYVVKAHPFKAVADSSRAHTKYKDKLAQDFKAADPDFFAYMSQVIPSNPTYTKLTKGIGLYRRLAESGECDKYKINKGLARGSKGPDVRNLALRLAAEGYLAEGAVSDKFGSEIEGAVKEYQKTHQLAVNGKVDDLTRKSLNVPMKTRLKQVELGLQRWRESDITKSNEPFYVRVNIPQFELEVWENGRRLRVHKVVVGNTDEVTNLEKRQKGKLNFTPLLAKEMKTIVLNPFWYPPPRLQKEVMAELEKTPDYLERHNFGVRMMDNGTEVIYQKAGNSNALGRVKFLFPNEHDVYFHDTNMKGYFNKTVRAYSHGCMRVENPLDLAEFILGRTNNMTREDINRALENTDKETYVKLKTPIPVFVEYNSVGVDENGRIEFYIDIYQYDRAYWDHAVPVKNARDLTTDEVRSLTHDGEDDVGEEGDDGVLPGAD